MRIFNESFSQTQEVWSQGGRSSGMGKARNGGTGRVSVLEDHREPAIPFCTLPSLTPHSSSGKKCPKVQIIGGVWTRLPEGGSDLLDCTESQS